MNEAVVQICALCWLFLLHILNRFSNRIHSEYGPCYTEHGLREQLGVSINVWRLAEGTLNITCNFLCCNHQVHSDVLITLCLSGNSGFVSNLTRITGTVH
jgi:hypothetical protein